MAKNLTESFVRIGIKATRILFEIVGALTLFFIASMFITMPWHDFVLSRMEYGLVRLPQPVADSEAVELKMFFGTPYTDTNECVYAVGEFRSTSYSKDEVRAAYRSASVAVFSSIWRMPVQVIIVEPDGATGLPLDNPADEWVTIFSREYDIGDQNTTYYLAYLYNPKQLSWGDWRCNAA